MINQIIRQLLWKKKGHLHYTQLFCETFKFARKYFMIKAPGTTNGGQRYEHLYLSVVNKSTISFICRRVFTAICLIIGTVSKLQTPDRIKGATLFTTRKYLLFLQCNILCSGSKFNIQLFLDILFTSSIGQISYMARGSSQFLHHYC